MKKVCVYAFLFLAILTASSFKFLSNHPPKSSLKLPGGFQSQVIADGLGAARHLAVAAKVLYMLNSQN